MNQRFHHDSLTKKVLNYFLKKLEKVVFRFHFSKLDKNEMLLL